MTTIGLKQVYTDLKNITIAAQQGHSFLVMKNAKPVFRIVPPQTEKPKKKYRLKDLKRLQCNAGGTLRLEMDDILYGSSR